MITLRTLGQEPYEVTFKAMREFTEQRHAVVERDSSGDELTGDELSGDELWLVEHPPTFTLGRAADPSHLLNPGAIPVVQSDRGGQVTYHGPGQVVVYLLLDLNHYGLGVQRFVRLIEQVMIDFLGAYGIPAQVREGAPGVYVQGKKIGSLGLRVVRGRSYHGLSLNVDMDMQPFTLINPCGYQGLQMTQMKEFLPEADPKALGERLMQQLKTAFEGLL